MNVTEAKCPNVTVTGVAEQELLTASELVLKFVYHFLNEEKESFSPTFTLSRGSNFSAESLEFYQKEKWRNVK